MCWNPKPASRECGICLPDPHDLNVGGYPFRGRAFGVVSWHGSGGLSGVEREPKGTSALPSCVWRYRLCNQPHHPLSPVSKMAVRAEALSFLFVSCPTLSSSLTSTHSHTQVSRPCCFAVHIQLVAPSKRAAVASLVSQGRGPDPVCCERFWT